ncbi:MAG: transporter [Deltaproteobacteria bacterium]|nr:transporter [Deltaproteobacteria bacterium]
MTIGACVALAAILPRSAGGQANQFGGQDRADAAARMIVLGVQQGIGSLPPTAGQSFTYEFDRSVDTWVESAHLGPTVLRVAETVGEGKLGLRVAASYFELVETFAPIPYVVSRPPAQPIGVAKLGLRADAHVGVLSVAANYGLTSGLEITINVPVVAVDAQATQAFTTRTATLSDPPKTAPLSGTPIVNDDVAAALRALDEHLAPGGSLSRREESFSALGFDFSDGTHAGLGRVGIGAKYVLYAERVQLAAVPEFFVPSPNADEFAGSDSAAILPRLVGAVDVNGSLKLHLDAGYDYDFDDDQLRRFVWNTGASLAFERATLDAGVGGSKYNRGIKWTPDSAPYQDTLGNVGAITALGDNQLGDNFVDVLLGCKIRLSERSVLGGAVTVPVNDEGFRPAATGTIAVELSW